MRHLIVFLPGIMGSALQKDGRDVWALSGEGLWHYLTTWGGSVQQLTIPQDDGVTDDLVDPSPELDDVGDEAFETTVDQPFHLLGITGFGDGREPHEIGEQHRHDPALLGG